MEDEATAIALNVREMHFSINRSLVLIYENQQFSIYKIFEEKWRC